MSKIILSILHTMLDSSGCLVPIDNMVYRGTRHFSQLKHFEVQTILN